MSLQAAIQPPSQRNTLQEFSFLNTCTYFAGLSERGTAHRLYQSFKSGHPAERPAS